MVEEAGLPSPDRVDYEPDELIFYWDEPKTAVVVELGEPPTSPSPARRSSRISAGS
jgi:hypothetical protein